ncbi:MAG: hypothetical protein ACREV5_10970 [Steroidobacter sp.]
MTAEIPSVEKRSADNVRACDPLGVSAVRDIEANVRPVQGNLSERFRLVSQKEVLARQHRADRHESVGLMIGQRAEQHRVDDAEDRAVGANAKRQRQDSNGREGWIPFQGDQAVAHVPRQIFDPGQPPLVVQCL